MAAEEEGKEEEVQEEGKKNYWWITLALLFLFLAGSGYLFLASSRTASQKMAGSENVNQYASEGPATGAGAAAARKADGFFASDEAVPSRVQASGSALNDKLKPGWVKEMAAEAAAASSRTGTAAQGEAVVPEGRGSSGAPAQAPQGGLTMASRLQARASFGGAAGASAPKAAAMGGPEAFQGNGAVVGKASVQRQTAAAAPKKGMGGSVMEALKGSFRASLYGARVASQDSAKSWIAKSFDASPDYDTAVQYDDDVRAKLDKVNPNAVPHFLREQDISSEEAKTLQVSDVGKPIVDHDAEEAALREDKEFQKRTAGASLSGSMINMLFAGLEGGMGGSSDATTNTSDSRAVTGADPEADPTLDTGPVNFYPTDLGTNYIFGSNGSLLGCEDDAAGMCLLPGADGCPSGLTMDSAGLGGGL